MVWPSPTPRIVLFGASGFLGRHVLRILVEAGFGVVCAARRRFEGARGVLRECDAQVGREVRELLNVVAPRHIVNCAALASVAACRDDPEVAQRMNCDFPAELAMWSAQNGARLLHVSTDLVFPGFAPAGGYTESALPEPCSLYGASKVAGERAVLAANPTALIVRLPLLFGDSHGTARGASDSVLTAVQRGERPVLFTDEWRTPLLVEDAASAIVQLAGKKVAGLLHVGGRERVSRFELGRMVLDAHGLARDCIRAGLQAELEGPRPQDVSLASGRARALVQNELRGPSAYVAC